MKKAYILFFLLVSIFLIDSRKEGFTATTGNPLDLDVPKQSAILRQDVIDDTLDECEQKVKIKSSLDIEFVLDKDLNTNPDITGAEMEGRWVMVKLGTTLFNRVEPYIKIGNSNLELRWKQGSQEIKVDSGAGFAWGAGLKGIICEFEDSGIRLTGDVQYRTTEPDVDKCSIDKNAVKDTGADFDVYELQASLVLSKKLEIPLKWQSIYMVPYIGATFSDSTIDAKFRDPNNPQADYTLFNANNQKRGGLVIGCDIVPSLKSAFIYSIEARLFNETALSLGGAMKF